MKLLISLAEVPRDKNDAGLDLDGDGLTNLEEFLTKTSPKIYTPNPKMNAILTIITNLDNRFYSPKIARFISIDNVGFIPANPLSFNRYIYANNNPQKYVDPDGRMTIQVSALNENVLDYHIQDHAFYEKTDAWVNKIADWLNPMKKLGKVGEAIDAAEDAEEIINVIPDRVGPKEDASLDDVIALDQRLAPYFADLNKKRKKGFDISPDDFLAVLKQAIIDEGHKDGSNAYDGNPVRDAFIDLYGVDEDGFVQAAKDNYKKSKGQPIE